MSAHGAIDPRAPAPPPSAPPPKGPRGWAVLLVLALVVAALAVGVVFGDRIAAEANAMVAALRGGEREEAQEGETRYYTCGMHPWVVLPAPGDCPICHMALVPLDPSKYSGEVAIDPLVVQNMGVRVEPVVTGPLVKRIRTVGLVDYDETRVRDVTTKVSGWVEELSVDSLGAPVAKGEELFRLYSPELYAAQEEYLLALKSAGAPGSTPARGLADAARTRLAFFDLTNEEIDAIARRGEPVKTLPIESSFEGVVIEKNVVAGARIGAGERLYRIADLSKVWVLATFYEYQLPYLAVGQRATMTLSYVPGQQWVGHVLYVYPYLDPKSREVRVRLEFENPGGLLKPGMFASVELESRLAEERVLAPRSAILDGGERKLAFVSLGEGRFDPRRVEVGVETEGDRVEVLRGLQPGELVVTSGQFLLDSEARIREALAKMVRGEPAAEQVAPAAESGASELDALPPAAAEALESLLRNDFAIVDELAADRIDGIAEPARAIADAIDRLLAVEMPGDPHFWHQHDEAATVRGKALELAGAEDLGAARLDFADLSLALGELLRATGIPPSHAAPVLEMHCPMYREGQGGSVWLQAADPVTNPYFGPSMLRCVDRRAALPVTGRRLAAQQATGAEEER